MLYLLDADTLISADRDAYPLNHFELFWEWLLFLGKSDVVKIPIEQYEEIIVGRGDLVDWLKLPDVREALVLKEEASAERVNDVTVRGYAADLSEDEIEEIGRDPFLISYGIGNAYRAVVTFERSAPARQRSRRKIPDVCADLGVACTTLFAIVRVLGFSTDWRPPEP